MKRFNIRTTVADEIVYREFVYDILAETKEDAVKMAESGNNGEWVDCQIGRASCRERV